MCIHERDDDSAGWNQYRQENRQMVEEALTSLAKGTGGKFEINLIAGFCEVRSPYARNHEPIR